MERRFACTRCGQCCNRAPELELGEAAALADVFVLRLMLRIYSLPKTLGDYVSELPREMASAEFYESKRLLGQFAASSWPARVRRGAAQVDYVQYLSLSVLPLDLGTAACPALDNAECSIYARRPLSCRSVPLHYSRPAAAAARDLDAFTATPGFACATGPEAPLVIAADAIIDPAMLAARAAAAARAEADRPWKLALVKAMKAGRHPGLPSPREVEAEAAQGVMTTTMDRAWHIAVAAGTMTPEALCAAIEAQRALIDQALARPGLPAETFRTLAAMAASYAAFAG